MIAPKLFYKQKTKSLLRSMGFNNSQKSLRTKKGFNKVLSMLDQNHFYNDILKELAEENNMATEKIVSIDHQIKILVEQHFKEEDALLRTIPAIGFVVAATILSVADTIDRFKTADQFSCYCGLIPSERSSGAKVVRGRITKEGDKELRSLLIQAAWVLIGKKKTDDERLKRLKTKFYRMAHKQKNQHKAATAIARHLSRIVFGVLKNKTAYCGTIAKN